MFRKNIRDPAKIIRMAEKDLGRLVRQYKAIERGKDPVSFEVKMALLRQRAIINRLEKDKEDLMQSLRAAQSPENIAKNQKLTASISNLLKTRLEHDARIRKEKEELHEIEEQIWYLEKEVVELRKKDLDDSRSRKLAVASEQKLARLENQLHFEMLKFNDMVTDNAKLKKEIDHLLKERERFNNEYQYFITKIGKLKKLMTDLLESATLNFNQRDDAMSQLHALIERGHLDLLLHSKQKRALDRARDQETKMRDLMGFKGQKRILADVIAREAAKKALEKQEMKTLTEEYETILTNIKEFKNELNLDVIAEEYIKQEEENFAQLQFINQLNDDLDERQIKVNDILNQIEGQRALNAETEREQQVELEELLDELDQKRTEREVAQDAVEDRNFALDQLYQGVEELFEITDCDRELPEALLGENQHVNVHNVMFFLCVVESRITELLNQVYYIEQSKQWDEMPCQLPLLKDKAFKKVKPVLIESLVPTNPCALCVEKEETAELEELPVSPLDLPGIHEKVGAREQQEDIKVILHNLSACRLPWAKKLVQRRLE